MKISRWPCKEAAVIAVCSTLAMGGIAAPSPAVTADTSAPTSTSSPSNGVEIPEPQPESAELRAAGKRLATTVSTPDRGQQSLVRMIVKSNTKPSLKVSKVSGKGTAKVTAVGGAKKVGKKKYALTVALLKPKASGAFSKPGKLRVIARGKKLRVVRQRQYLNVFAKKISGEICTGVRKLDASLSKPNVRAAFDDKLLYGKGLRGFAHPKYLGAYALQKSCGKPTSQSFINQLRGSKAKPVVLNSPAPANAAVVFLSGFSSTQPFTAPGKSCAAGPAPLYNDIPNTVGAWWSYATQQLASEGRQVYTAPIGLGEIAPDPSAYGGGACTLDPLSLNMTIDSSADQDLNGARLALFLDYLHSNYGVNDVHLVGHSDGGIWSRSAMDYANIIPVNVHSIITVDSPHIGALAADLLVSQQNIQCETLNLLCDAWVAFFKEFANSETNNTSQVAIEELQYAPMVEWNARMKGVLGALPVYAQAGIGVQNPQWADLFEPNGSTNPYFNPSDLYVGLASAQADGLVAQGVIQNLECFTPIPALHTDFGSSAQELVDLGISTTTMPIFDSPQTLANIKSVLDGTPISGACTS